MEKNRYTPLMTIDEVAEALRISAETVRRKAHEARIPGQLPRIGRAWRFNRRLFFEGIGEPGGRVE